MTILPDEFHLVALSIRTDTDGSPSFIQATAKSHGTDYVEYQSRTLAELQVNGTETLFTYAETIIDEYSVAVVAKINGRVYTRATRRISDDGQTMTIDATALPPGGQERRFVLVFDRQ